LLRPLGAAVHGLASAAGCGCCPKEGCSDYWLQPAIKGVMVRGRGWRKLRVGNARGERAGQIGACDVM
jgi:hypothetical protein